MTDEFISVTFYGVRGSHGTCGPNYQEYGGNTSCVEIRMGSSVVIMDAGLGIRACGKQLMAEGRSHCSLLFSHMHWDHIQGFPFFLPAFNSKFTVDIYAGLAKNQGIMAADDENGIKSLLERQMKAPFFPMPMSGMPGHFNFTNFKPGDTFMLTPEISVLSAPLNHPNGATGYRLTYRGKSVSYITDTEHIPGQNDQNVLNLMKDSSLIIYDCAYNAGQMATRKGWGHSTWMEGVRLCGISNVTRLAMFHHDPDNDDKIIAQMENEAKSELPDCFAARERMTVRIPLVE